MTRLRAAAIGLLIAAGCGAPSETVTATIPASTTATAPTTTTPPAPTTTAVQRSVWCNNRGAGLWPNHEPTPYDPAPLDTDKATILKRLDRSLEQQIGQANAMYDNMADTYADDPAILTEVEQGHRSLIAQIRAAYRTTAADVEARFAREHREARAAHDAHERQRAELAAAKLSNEIKRYEIECR